MLCVADEACVELVGTELYLVHFLQPHQLRTVIRDFIRAIVV